MAILTINNAYCGDAVCFGYLYNWYAVDDARELTSSDDWVVPTEAIFDAFILYLDPSYTSTSTIAGAAMAKTGTVYWDYDIGTDLYGFGAKGAGSRNNSGIFSSMGAYAEWWASNEYSPTRGRIMNLAQSTASNLVATSTGGNVKQYGQSVRLVKSAIGLPDGTTTTYTGNDGKTYNAVVINQLYWTTENLEETQYRNGEYIGGYNASGYIPISDASWAALTTGALCLYEDNLDYACKGAILGTTTTTIPVTTTTTTI